MKKLILLFLTILFSSSLLSAQSTKYSQSEDFDRVVKELMQYRALPSDELMVKVAEYFLGTPYVAGTLEGTPEELRIDIRKTDCILFVEQCLAITYLLSTAEEGTPPTFEDFRQQILGMRYRDGILDGYASRLHYASEWILQNEAAGLIKEITAQTGGRKLSQQFSFMSTHTGSYAALDGNPKEIERIEEVERSLNSATEYYYIPASEIPGMEHKIQDGDIIFFTSKIEGLDITHVAIAYTVHDGEDGTDTLHFIHASTRAGKVIVEPKTLAGYTKTGIRLARVTF